jgi:hypothetical protein
MKNRRLISCVGMSVVVVVAAFTGCSSNQKLFTRDGRPTSLVQCSADGSWNECLQNARGICGGDFDVIEHSLKSGTRNLLFACKTSRNGS